jgi:acyl carrier protein
MSEPTPLVLREHIPLLPAFVAPVTPAQQRLAEIWCTVLGMDRVGIHDPYDDLGGDSLAAAAIFFEIEKVFAVTLPMAILLEAPTVAQLAGRIDAAAAEGCKEG